MENNRKQADFNFENFTQEASENLNELAEQLGNRNEKARTMIVWKAVMHSIREGIHMGESLDLISPLPLLLKGMYVQNWKYHEKPPLEFESMEEFKKAVEQLQDQYREVQFNWNKSTEEIISICLHSLEKYLSKGQIQHIKGQMPKEVEVF